MIGVAEVLLTTLGEAYDRKGWHGPTLRGALRGVTSREALWRPKGERHNIWELTLHCAYWKFVVCRRLTHDRRGKFPMKGSNFFPSGEGHWRDAVRLLDEEHARLRSAIEALPKATFNDRKRVRMIYGIAAHDLYHAGQIQLLKRLQRS
ncbi:MAG TPA: DinB family protein [Thermoanaerobaculia bacterium]|nr:DinB family protein [Thermoanaerobaculia bacterium]